MTLALVYGHSETGMDDEDIEIVSGWPGDSGAFIRAIVALRLLDLAEATYHLHDWQEHNPWPAKLGLLMIP